MSGDWFVRVPASSANLGAGFDVLGMALSLHAEVGVGEPPDDARAAEPTHPASVAFRRLGGEGPIWVRSPIPMGRGLGFSGAVRVGGALAALVQRDGVDAARADLARADVLTLTSELEGHADNVAASLFGGIVVCAGAHVQQVPLRLDPAVVVWIPDGTTTSTDQSRASLPTVVPIDDVVFNLGRVATFVAAFAAGDVGALRMATEDRLHQPARLADVPICALAIESALAAGAWGAWLSGSGPTVAVMCAPDAADAIAAALPAEGHSKRLAIDTDGAVVVDDGSR